MNPNARMGAIAVLIAVVLFCGAGGIFYAVTRTPTTGQVGLADGKPNSDGYPYPECAECVRHLKENSGDPESIQPISWERGVVKEDVEFMRRGDLYIRVTYRTRTKFGGWDVEGKSYYFRDGRRIAPR